MDKVVEDNDLETENKPLLDWLKVACMQDGFIKIQRGSYPDMLWALRNRLLEVVTHDLPVWGHANSLARFGAPTNKGNQNWQNEVLGCLVEQLTQPTAPRGSHGDGTKVPSEAWPHTIGVLFSLVGVAHDDELPPIYGVFVNTRKEHRRQVLQTDLERVARLMRSQQS